MVDVDEVWEERPCPTCHGHTPIYEGMICNDCGGFGFKMQMISQTQYVNGEWLMVDNLRDPIKEARERMVKARDELQKAAVRYSLGEISDEEFQEFLLEHYKAQMEMSKLVEHWPAYQRRE